MFHNEGDYLHNIFEKLREVGRENNIFGGVFDHIDLMRWALDQYDLGVFSMAKNFKREDFLARRKRFSMTCQMQN